MDLRFLSTRFSLCLAFFFAVIGCASPGAGPRGIIYSKTKIGIYSNGESNISTGRSCVHSILGLLALGDASTDSAKKNGNINQITSVNWEASNYFSIYASLCVIVGGKK